MLFNLNAGHTLSGGDIGTRGLNGLKEEQLTRQLVKELDVMLRQEGHRTNLVIVDYAKTLDDSLDEQVMLCNSVKADFNIVIHFNSVPKHVGHGSEIYTYNGKYLIQADRILKNLNKLGFSNRGIKNQQLALINKTYAETLYIEVCFIDNTQDVNIFNKVGMKNIARAITCGVLNKNFSAEQNTIPVKQHRNVVVYSGDVDKTIAEIMAWKLEDCSIVPLNKYKPGMGKSVYVIGAACNSNIAANVKLQGKNREETLKMVEKRVGLR